jgi:hypothetical protein
MLCFPLLTLATDAPYWIARDTFFSAFSQSDFHCREVIKVRM